MKYSRKRNLLWETPCHPDNTWQHIEIEVLQDIRDELRSLNALLHCVNFVTIPDTLKVISRNTAKAKRKSAVNG